MKRLLSTKEKIEIGIFRFLSGFQGYRRLERDIKQIKWEKEQSSVQHQY